MDVILTVGGQTRWSGRLEPRQRRSVFLGTEPGCDVVLGGAGIMPRHAEIGVDETGPWLCAHAAVTMDGRAVVGWALIEHGTRLMVGEHEVVFAAQGPAGEPFERAAAAARVAKQEPSTASTETAEQPAASMAQLGELFALPPPEAAAAAKDATPFLKRRFIGMPVRSWILASTCGVIGLFFFATREVPRASAGRSVAPPTVRAVAPTKERAGGAAPARAGKPIAIAELRAAADQIFAGDNAAALTRYRALAERDPSFAPFVRALEQRMKKKCTPGITGGGSECQ